MVSLFIFKVFGLGMFALAVLVFEVNAQSLQCSDTQKCPESAPCCSEYGFCGSGAFCLGGCNPLQSFNATSCAPNPICISNQYTFGDQNRLVDTASFNGDPATADWTTGGQPLYQNGNIILTLAKGSGGTKISTTRYVYYGKMTARLRTSRGAGVVSSFITMSNVKDEIDWEWVGKNTLQGQSNFFYRGTLDYTHSAVHSITNDSWGNWHDYTIDWTQDSITWLIDGTPVRTQNRSNGQFPSTPSRLQLGIWDAGATGASGTITWAGGVIDWANNPDVLAAGYLYVQVQSVTILCYGQEGAGGNLKGTAQVNPQLTSYVYSDNATVSLSSTNTSVKLSTPQSEGLPSGSGDPNANVVFYGAYVPPGPNTASKAVNESWAAVLLCSIVALLLVI